MGTKTTPLDALILGETEEQTNIELAEINATMPYTMVPLLTKHDLSPYQSMDYTELEALAKPTSVEYMAKKAFWKGYKAASKAGRKMNYKGFLHGICSPALFKRLLASPIKAAWLMQPTALYNAQVESLLDRSMCRYEELISMSIMTKKKIKVNDEDILIDEVDAKKAMVLLSVIKNLEERVNGSAVQRQVSVKTTEPSANSEAKDAKIDMDAVNDRLRELEEKLGETPLDVIEVINEA